MGVHDGHRDRMRKRFLENELNGFADHEAVATGRCQTSAGVTGPGGQRASLLCCAQTPDTGPRYIFLYSTRYSIAQENPFVYKNFSKSAGRLTAPGKYAIIFSK